MQVEHGKDPAVVSPPALPSRSARTPRRTLLGAQLLFNLGFYAVVPFIALVLTDDFALGGAAVGAVLGVRTFAQQGMFLLGGILTDRFGARAVILVGCGVRALGFLTLAASLWPAVPSLPWFVVGTVTTGLGGALFSPALNTLVATADARHPADGADRTRTGAASARPGTAGAERGTDAATPPADGGNPPSRRPTTLFAWLTVAGEFGAAAGPLVGAALLGWGFATVAASGAVLFAVVGVALWRLLPAPSRSNSGLTASGRGSDSGPSADRGSGSGSGRQETDGGPGPAAGRPLAARRAHVLHRPRLCASLHQPAFVAFAALHSVDLLAYNQLYLSLPLALRRADAASYLIGGLFAWVSVLTITLQLPLARWCAAVGPRTALRTGYLLTASAFALLAGGALVGPDGGLVVLPMAAASLMIVGHLVAMPTALSVVPAFAAGRPTGSFYGLLATAGGITVLVGNLAVGRLTDLADAHPAAAPLPWLLLAVLPAISAIVVGRLGLTLRTA